jgi:hypothetical protein
LQGYTTGHTGRKFVRSYYGLPPRYFQEHPDESDRPSFRADTIEQAVLAKLQQFMSNERTKRAIRSEINRRMRKQEVHVGRYESQLADLRAKIERGTENLALASREDLPGISRLLAGWREQETQVKEQLQRPRGPRAVARGVGDSEPARRSLGATAGSRSRKALVCHSTDRQADHAATGAPT